MTLSVYVKDRNSDKTVIENTVITKKSVSQGLTSSTYTICLVSREYLCLPSVNMFSYIDDMVIVSDNTNSTQQQLLPSSNEAQMHKIILSSLQPSSDSIRQQHNIKNILDNWIHTLLDETLIEAPATSSHSTNPSKLNSKQKS